VKPCAEQEPCGSAVGFDFFDFGSYSNIKESMIFLVPESMPAVQSHQLTILSTYGKFIIVQINIIEAMWKQNTLNHTSFCKLSLNIH